MSIENIDLRGTTAAGGTATITAGKSVIGRLLAVEWVDGTLVDGVDAVLKVTNRQSGVDRTLLTLTDANADAFYYPREQVHGLTGAGLDYNDESDEPVSEMPLIDGTLVLTIADGGATKYGGAIVYVLK